MKKFTYLNAGVRLEKVKKTQKKKKKKKKKSRFKQASQAAHFETLNQTGT
jgi:hypothetical protein